MPSTAEILRDASAEVAVLGLGKSGVSAAWLLATHGHPVYASDAGSSDAVRAGADRLAALSAGWPEELPLGLEFQWGRHDLDRIRRSRLVVASPGIPPEAPPLAAARSSGIPIVSEIEVGLHWMPTLRYIAVTGTNGKTTTTALIGHLLRALGHDAPDAGNIGLPLTEVALQERHPQWLALELSSFQLHDTPGIKPTVAVLTNLSPDHLDRYPGVDEYYADKALLFRNADEHSHSVLNEDDEQAMSIRRWLPDVASHRSSAMPGRTWTFSLERTTASGFYDRERDALVVLGDPLVERKDLRLLGDHNVANALAAAVAVMVADPSHRTPEARVHLGAALRSFRALKHRMELVGEVGGVQWINDSKATNVSSTLVALKGMTRPYILLLGGRHKGEPYTALAEAFAPHGKTVLAFGESAPIIEQDLGGRVPVERLGSSFEDVIRRARELAGPGDAVLLSPACSSFDMFTNYEQRGAEFRRLSGEGAS